MNLSHALNISQEQRGFPLPREWPMLVGLATSALFFAFGRSWLADLSKTGWLAFMFVWPFAVILISAFAVVRHAESLAAKLGEPLGTLVLTLSITGIEVMMISSVMFTGEGHPALARDSVVGVVMIGLNGVIGLSLLLGGLRYREQQYNLQGAQAFLAVLVPLLVLGLILPNYTASGAGGTMSPTQAGSQIVLSIALYGVFLAIQNVRHREYFLAPSDARAECPNALEPDDPEIRSPLYHFPLLLVYLLLIVHLARQIAVPIDHGIDVLKLPPALGGLLVSVLVMTSESMGAVRAAMANQLQRSVNLLLGGVLASTSLTIPAVLAIGLISGQTIILGLEPVEMTLLLLTLGVSALTFATARTNVLLGAVHLALFLAYLMLVFEK
jgi:Ca2+:H+ antiporter